MSSVQLCAIQKRFASQLVLDSLSLHVAADEYFVLLGQSGCGKTTTLRVIAGIESPDAGNVLVAAEDVTSQQPRKRDVSLMFQGDGLYPHMTVRQTLAYPIKGMMPAVEIERRIACAARLLGLDALLDRHPEKLSGGELRRAGLAKSVVRQATVRLLDEPLSALDGAVRYQFQQDLNRWHREIPGTTIHVTHDGDEAMRMADRIAVMHQGRIVQVGTPEEIYHHPSCIAVAQSLGSPPINLIKATLRGGQLRLPWGTFPAVTRNDVVEDHVVLAIRPESFRLATEPPAANGLVATAICRWRQVFGGCCHARFELDRRDNQSHDAKNEVQVNAILDQDCGVQVGDTVTLGVQSRDVQLFAGSGERIEWE
ncbi:ABC transporter ATP-binding protein [Novipirellula sp.]|uniref:ABC transporter ATP-binding protein n=1 Tax=Novipirellula sp. TaxID=2795430 RepID=UPI00356A4506